MDKHITLANAMAVAKHIEDLREEYVGTTMHGRTGWSWEYRNPRDPSQRFRVVVGCYAKDAGDLLQGWVNIHVDEQLLEAVVDATPNGATVTLTPRW